MPTVKNAALANIILGSRAYDMVISLISTAFRHVSMIYLTFRVLFVKFCSLMFCLDSSVPEDVPRCSASMLALLTSFINSVPN